MCSNHTLIGFVADSLFDKGDGGASRSTANSGGNGLLADAAAVYGDVSCPLDDVPKRVTVRGDQYALRAVATFVNPGRKARADTVGHYVAIALRENGRWLEYDGLEVYAIPVAGSSNRGVQMVLYTKRTGSQ